MKYTKIIIAITCLCLISCKYKKTPRLILSKYIYNFGIVEEGTVCSGFVKVYNKGNDYLHIRNFSSDCGCTKVFINKNSIAEGDSAILQFSIDTSHKLGDVEYNAVIEANTDSILHFVRLLIHVKEKHNSNKLLQKHSNVL